MPQTATFDAQALQNSRVTQLTVPAFAANIWKSAWVDVSMFRRLDGILAMDQPSAPSGVVIEQSTSAAAATDADAHYYTATGTTLSTNPVTAQAYHNVAYSVERVGLFARLIVKHNGVQPTVFVARMIGAGIT